MFVLVLFGIPETIKQKLATKDCEWQHIRTVTSHENKQTLRG